MGQDHKISLHLVLLEKNIYRRLGIGQISGGIFTYEQTAYLLIESSSHSALGCFPIIGISLDRNVSLPIKAMQKTSPISLSKPLIFNSLKIWSFNHIDLVEWNHKDLFDIRPNDE